MIMTVGWSGVEQGEVVFKLQSSTKDAVESSWNTASERYKGAII